MKKLIYHSILCSLLSMLFMACGEDRTYEYLEKTEENQWTYSKMNEVYLWADSVKKPERSGFFTNTSKFFSSLLYKGDKVSFFTDTVSSGSYGLTFAVMRDPIGERPSKAYALALYVEPGSPADVAGVERGTWISKAAGKAISMSGNAQLLQGDAIELVTEYIDFDDEEMRYYWVSGDTLTMPASVAVNEAAIPVDSIYSLRDRKIGYLLCNNFNGDDFVAKSQNVLLGFVEEGVTDVVIDLRYNSGGSISNAASLAGSFVPASSHGTLFCTLKGKDELADTSYCYEAQMASLADKKLYIIVSEATTGTAELFTSSVNTSRDMYDVLTVGTKSAGAAVMTEAFPSPFGFTINPAVAMVHNAAGELLPASGIVADYQVDELAEPEQVFALGSEQEYILRNVEYLIVNGALPESVANVTATSVSRKKVGDFLR